MSNFEDFRLPNPLEIKGKSAEDRTAFFELAKQRIVYQTREENRTWRKKHVGTNDETTATFVVGSNNVVSSDLGKWVDTLQIVVNTGILADVSDWIGEDCSALTPYLVEHELFEAYLNAKKNSDNLTFEQKHLLARRREFILAGYDNLEDRLYKFQMAVNPASKAEYDEALGYAKRVKSRRQ